MKVRILKSGSGCIYQPGSLIRVSDKRARYMIEAGVAEPADEKVLVSGGMPVVSTSTIFLKPPRYICGCGFVAPDAQALREHKKECR